MSSEEELLIEDVKEEVVKYGLTKPTNVTCYCTFFYGFFF